MSKKNFLHIVLLSCIFILWGGWVSANNTLTLQIHGNTHKNIPYVIEGGEVLIPARTLVNELGGTVEWNVSLKLIRVLFDDGQEIRLQIDNPVVNITSQGGRSRTERLPVPPKLVGGQAMVPISFFIGHFGQLYRWHEETKTAEIYRPSNWVFDLSYDEEPDNEVLVITSLKKVPYTVHTLGSPDRLVIDFQQSTLSARATDILWSTYIWKSVRIAQHTSDIVRVVVNLNNVVKYQIVEELDAEGFKVRFEFAPGIRQVTMTDQGLVIKSTGEISDYKVMVLPDPERLVIDIPGQTLQLERNTIPVTHPLVKQVRASQLSWDPNIVRLVLDLNEKIEYNILRGKTAKEIVVRTKELPVRSEPISVIQPGTPPTTSQPPVQPTQPNPGSSQPQPPDTPQPGSSTPESPQRPRGTGTTVEFVMVDVGKDYSEHELVSISIIEGINQRVVIRTSTPITYKVSYMPNPDRLVVDLQGAVSRINTESISAGKGNIRGIRMHQHPNMVRVVFDLSQYISHQVISPERTQNIEISLGQNPLAGKVIVLDPGHGGSDPGAIGPTGLFEKTVNLEISLKLRDMLRDAGATVIMTRDKDVYPTLGERVDLANQLNADIFVSIHANSFKGVDPGGTETFFAPKNRAMSLPLATAIQIQLVKAIGLFDRGVKSSEFYVLNHTTMPSALVEVAFISKRDEEVMLKDSAFQLKAAQGIYEGILAYFTQILESGGGQ